MQFSLSRARKMFRLSGKNYRAFRTRKTGDYKRHEQQRKTSRLNRFYELNNPIIITEINILFRVDVSVYQR